jgi:hypothetical protein
MIELLSLNLNFFLIKIPLLPITVIHDFQIVMLGQMGNKHVIQKR